MASGIAFHWDKPSRSMLNLYDIGTSTERQATGSQTILSPRTGRRTKSLKSVSSTGTLGRVPVEILQEILLDLDLCTLVVVLRLHSFYYHLVGSLSEYKLLTENAQETLCIMNITKTISYFSTRCLFAEFCHPWCWTCGDFGAYLFLVTCRRCCLNCLESSRWEYELAPTKYIKRRYALTGESRKQLNVLHTPSYFYRIDRRHPDRRDRRLASEQAAFELGVKTHGGKRGMEDAAEALYKSSCREYERARDAGADEDYVVALLRLIVESYFGNYDVKRWRFMGSTASPVWDTRRQVLEVGTYCSACAFSYVQDPRRGDERVQQRRSYNRAFLLSEIPGHFLNCNALKGGYKFGQRSSYQGSCMFRHGEDFRVSPDGKKIVSSDSEFSEGESSAEGMS